MKYKILDNSKQNLTQLGFRCKGDYYEMRFPVFRSNKIPVLFAIIRLFDGENIFRIDVVNSNDVPYSHWYIREKISIPFIRKIDKAIQNKMKKIGAKKIED